MVFLDVMVNEYFMTRALQLARKAAGKTSPNPMVGAVLVKKGEVIAEDYHRRAGTPHAEALVIKRATRIRGYREEESGNSSGQGYTFPSVLWRKRQEASTRHT
jgi:pyrimidine deaminase RibD-like protein